jgi:dCMP deaminase
MNRKTDSVYIKMAEALSMMSYADRAKVGCLIVNPEGQIVSQGYNGTPAGFDNTCEENSATKPEVLHAESNAISKCAKWGGSTDGATLYVTLSPCFECAKLIIQSGIKRVVYKDEYRDISGIALLKKANIEVVKYTKNTKN